MGKPLAFADAINLTLRAVETRIICTGVPVAATNSNKQAIAEVSEKSGFPGKPKRMESVPSRISRHLPSIGDRNTKMPRVFPKAGDIPTPALPVPNFPKADYR